MAANAFDMEFDRLKSEVAGLRKQIGNLLDAVKTPTGQERERRFYQRAYDRARQAGETARERASDAYGVVDKNVKQRPWTSSMVALGTGIVLGVLLDHRYRH
jgi:ElaB/YqjD/DUF883 family membrane-anchored ribosome-binding protein